MNEIQIRAVKNAGKKIVPILKALESTYKIKITFIELERDEKKGLIKDLFMFAADKKDEI